MEESVQLEVAGEFLQEQATQIGSDAEGFGREDCFGDTGRTNCDITQFL